MKDFILHKDLITKNVINSVSKNFEIKRYGIKRCGVETDCSDLDLIRYELLQWQISIIKDTVIQPIPPEIENIYWGFFNSDPINNISTLSFQFQKQVELSSDMFLLNFTQASNNTFLVLKEPISQTIKTTWYNTNFNYGIIPDQVFRAPIIEGEFRYYISRNPVLLQDINTSIRFS